MDEVAKDSNEQLQSVKPKFLKSFRDGIELNTQTEQGVEGSNYSQISSGVETPTWKVDDTDSHKAEDPTAKLSLLGKR